MLKIEVIDFSTVKAKFRNNHFASCCWQKDSHEWGEKMLIKSKQLFTSVHPQSVLGKIIQFPIMRILIVALFIAPFLLFHNKVIADLIASASGLFHSLLVDADAVVSISGPEWITGGSFGIEASVIAVCLSLGVAIGILKMSINKQQIVSPVWKR